MNKISRLWKSLLVLGVVLLGLVSGCAQVPDQPQEPAQMVNSGSWYSRERWPHDGKPYEGQHFVVYSDGAGQEARQSAAEMGEELMAKLITQFGIVPDEMFRFPRDQAKIHIYVYKNRFPQAWGARGYYGGLLIWSLDHEERDTSDLDNYAAVLKHELVHVVESLLKGRDATIEPRTDLWFSEGLAEAISGGTQVGAIRDLDHLNYLIGKYGRLNPIAFKSDSQVGDYTKRETQLAYWEYHYPMYQLAVEYLMAADGFGKSPRDVTYVFTDMAEGKSFSTAFENRMGISLEDYEEQFFDLVNDYLDEGGAFTNVERMSLTWFFLTAGSLIVLAWDLARGAGARWRLRLAWGLVTALFGPLGLLGYALSCRRSGRPVSNWWGALGASLYSATGNAIGMLFVIAYYLFPPAKDAGLVIFLVPLIVGWLIFRSPLVAAQPGGKYWVAVRRTLLAECISTILVSAGMLPVLIMTGMLPVLIAGTPPVLIMLPEQWWYFALNPKNPLFWGVFPLGAIVGAVILYPYNVWMVRRGSTLWPGWATTESEST